MRDEPSQPHLPLFVCFLGSEILLLLREPALIQHQRDTARDSHAALFHFRSHAASNASSASFAGTPANTVCGRPFFGQ